VNCGRDPAARPPAGAACAVGEQRGPPGAPGVPDRADDGRFVVQGPRFGG